MEYSTFKSLVSFLWCDNWPGQSKPSIIKKKFNQDRLGSHSIEMIVACGVLYLTGKGTNSLSTLGLRIPDTTYRTYARDVINELVNKCDCVIRIPSPSKQYFFPDGSDKLVKGAVFALDGTHCRLRFGGKNRYELYNHKKFFSINTMIVCDWNLNIVAINCCYTGRTHDSHVWKSSPLYKALLYDSNHLVLRRNCFIMADMGYACSNKVITPYKSLKLNKAQELFNKRITQARGRVERAIGLLKKRCRVLDSGMHASDIRQVTNEILACAVLHQYCRYEEIKDVDYSDHLLKDHTPYDGLDSFDAPQMRKFLTNKWAEENNVTSNTGIWIYDCLFAILSNILIIRSNLLSIDL